MSANSSAPPQIHTTITKGSWESSIRLSYDHNRVLIGGLGLSKPLYACRYIISSFEGLRRAMSTNVRASEPRGNRHVTETLSPKHQR